jgi:hypothetical protein
MSDASTAAILLMLLGTTVSARPVQLVVSEGDADVVLAVVGHADRKVGARYVLTSESAGNAAKQAGRVSLEPDKVVTLITLKLDGEPRRHWKATLSVDLDDGTHYELSQTSSERQ